MLPRTSIGPGYFWSSALQRRSEQESTADQGQLPPLAMSWGAVSPAQRRSHAALVQLTEQEPVQVMWQVELPLHETLPLAPTVAVQVELPVQLRLHDSAHAPAQLVWFEHESEQLPAPAPQDWAVKPQLAPELQVQLAPVQVGGGAGLEPPQAPRKRTRMARKAGGIRMTKLCHLRERLARPIDLRPHGQGSPGSRSC
jgi:hypothetical protein